MSKTAQPDPESAAKKSHGPWSYALWGFVMVMVYVLSSGPVAKRTHNDQPEWVRTIYCPLNVAYERSPLRKPLGLYWHLWLPYNFDKHGEWIGHTD